jgi:hypothetical protein
VGIVKQLRARAPFYLGVASDAPNKDAGAALRNLVTRALAVDDTNARELDAIWESFLEFVLRYNLLKHDEMAN